MLRLSFLDTFFLVIPFGNLPVPAIAVEIGLFTFQRNQHCLVALAVGALCLKGIVEGLMEVQIADNMVLGMAPFALQSAC